MAIASMTGFARVDGAVADARWTWEVRSVNGRGLEARFRLPQGRDALEPALRKSLGEAFSRGNFTATLDLEGGGGGGLVVNREALEAAIRAVEEIRMRIDCDRPRAEGILAIRGVVEPGVDADRDDRRRAVDEGVVASFAEALAALGAARRREGDAINTAIIGQIDEAARLSAEARRSAATAPEAIRARIAGQLGELLGGQIAPDRLAQEAALLAVKADVREELDRLDAHLTAARALLAEKGAVGRRFDFLTQELNREANTLCSKAADVALKRVGLDLKSVIDQMREQAQNIE
jgi:uncharacterized protein (TIGR00255 family)